jgi:molybdate transport system ATP-binding protein
MGLQCSARLRVAIGRALLVSPRLLLMDEPLAALDAGARGEIFPYLERLHAELSIPVLYVSHSPAEVLRLADHLLLLAAGRLRAAGPLHEIATRLDLLPWVQEAELGAVIEAQVGEHDESFALTYFDFAGGRLTVPRQPYPLGSRKRVRVLARDVSLALDHPRRTSVLNVFAARIVEIAELGDSPEAGVSHRIDDASRAAAAGRAQHGVSASAGPAHGAARVLVKLDVGGATLLAQITGKSWRQLALRPGLPVYALVKSVALVA